jgi:transcriptional regulator with XRE-family HTH domain
MQDTPLRRWRVCKGWTQKQLGEKLAETMRALGERVAEEKGIWHTAISRYELGTRMPRPVLRGLRELTGLSYEALVEPELYLAKRPHAFEKGKRPLQETPGYPLGRPRKPRKHSEQSSAGISG